MKRFLLFYDEFSFPDLLNYFLLYLFVPFIKTEGLMIIPIQTQYLVSLVITFLHDHNVMVCEHSRILLYFSWSGEGMQWISIFFCQPHEIPIHSFSDLLLMTICHIVLNLSETSTYSWLQTVPHHISDPKVSCQFLWRKLALCETAGLSPVQCLFAPDVIIE